MLGRLSVAGAEQRLELAASAVPTYAWPAGRTLGDEAPAHGFVLAQQVGRGADAFTAAREALRTLGPQRAVARVHPVGATASLGDDVIVAVSMGPVTVVASNRIVAVVDEPRRFAFAYGTLPGHPEQGEEGFEVTRRTDDVVIARIVVDAVPAVAMGRLLAAPVLLASRHYGRRYLAAIASAVAAGVSSGA
jgi:uncharacterized protein (UPF0548 family)